MAGVLKIIAEKAGLSQSTVSQILNRRSNDFSSAETKQKVFAIAKELGYKQNFGHQLLRGDKTQTVGILFSMGKKTIEEHLQSLIIQLLTKLEERKFGTYLVTMTFDAKNNIRIIQDLVNRGTDCFIIIGEPVGEKKIEQEFIRLKKPFIGYITGFSRDIKVDLSSTCEKIIRYFIENGKENFRFFLGDQINMTRWQGLKNVFPNEDDEELKKRYYFSMGADNIDNIDSNDLNAQIGYKKTAEALLQDPNINGFFYLSDYYATGGIRYLLEHGYKIGSDVFVAGINDIYAIRNSFFPIISARHPIGEIADCMIQEMDKTGEFHRVITLQPIIRK